MYFGTGNYMISYAPPKISVDQCFQLFLCYYFVLVSVTAVFMVVMFCSLTSATSGSLTFTENRKPISVAFQWHTSSPYSQTTGITVICRDPSAVVTKVFLHSWVKRVCALSSFDLIQITALLSIAFFTKLWSLSSTLNQEIYGNPTLFSFSHQSCF